MTKKERFLRVLKIFFRYFILAAVFCVLAITEISEGVAPFALAFLFGARIIKNNPIAAAVLFFGASLLAGVSRESLIANGLAVAVFMLYVLTEKILSAKLKRKKNLDSIKNALLSLFYIFSNAGFLFFEIDGAIYKTLTTVIIGLIFLFAVISVLGALKTKKAKIPWTPDQIISLFAVIVVLSIGFSALNSFEFSVVKLVAVFVALVGIYYFDIKQTVILLICIGLGQAFATQNLNYVAIYAVYAIVSSVFKSKLPIMSIIAIFLADLVFGFYFDAFFNYDVLSLLPIVLGSALFLSLPKKVWAFLDFDGSRLAGFAISKNTINRNRAGVCESLNKLSNVFGEMQNVYRNLVKGTLSAEESAELATACVLQEVCDKCPTKHLCKREPKDDKEISDAILNTAKIGAMKGGSVSALDMPHILTIKCQQHLKIAQNLNKQIAGIKNKIVATNGFDGSKILMANLLDGTSKLCASFADEISRSVVYDSVKADFVKDELLYFNIVASDVLISKNNKGEFVVSVLVGRRDAKNAALPKIISKALGVKMQVDSIDDAETAGFSVVSLKNSPRYKLIFGVAQVAKEYNRTCGDSFSFLRLTNEQSLMAVCDGMGAGELANRASTLTLSLLENFYKAGFPTEIIMSSVNQLLTVSKQEIFSALDICILNSATGEASFIKVGGADGFIKRDLETDIIEAGSLPIGVLDEVRPKITKAVLADGDFVVLTSDGIDEAFSGDRVKLANFINNLKVRTPQELADVIMQEGLNRSGKIMRDDSTVIVAKLIEIID